MKKTEKILFTTLAFVALVGVSFFAFQSSINLPASPEEKALAEAGAVYGEKGHSEMKSLLKTATKGLSGELDLSDDAQKHLFGEPRGCVLDSKSGTLGGQWFISSWITAPKGDLEKLRNILQTSNSNLTDELNQNDNSLILKGTQSEQVTAKKIDSDTFEVTLASKCYGEN